MCLTTHGFVWRFCRDPATADDVVQETFIRAWQHLPQLRADSRPIRPWLFRVARNLLTDAGRAAQSRPVTVPASAAEEPGDDLLAAAALDLTRCGLVLATARHPAPATGLVAAGLAAAAVSS